MFIYIDNKIQPSFFRFLALCSGLPVTFPPFFTVNPHNKSLIISPKLVWSRWQDIGLVQFFCALFVYGPCLQLSP